MHISFQALALAALGLEGTLAQPAHHRHQHKHRRDLADVLGENLEKRVDFNDKALYANVDWKETCKNGACDGASKQPASLAGDSPSVSFPSVSVNIPSATPISSAAAAPSGSSSSSSSTGSTGSTGSSTGSCSDLKSVWDKNSADSSSPRGGNTSADGLPFYEWGIKETPAIDGGSKDKYSGNYGEPYGHNMYPLTDCDVSGQNYSITFTNAGSSQIQVAMWNKVGDDHVPLTGAWRNAFWKFPLEPGQSGAFAVQSNTQMAFSQACDRPGQFDCTWGEGDFNNFGNNGFSGYDRSSIQNGKGNTGLLTLCVDGHDCSSQQSHSFVSDKQTDAGGDLTVGPDQKMHLKVTMG